MLEVFGVDLGRVFYNFFNAREIISQEVNHEIDIQFWLGHGGGKAEGKWITLGDWMLAYPLMLAH